MQQGVSPSSAKVIGFSNTQAKLDQTSAKSKLKCQETLMTSAAPTWNRGCSWLHALITNLTVKGITTKMFMQWMVRVTYIKEMKGSRIVAEEYIRVEGNCSLLEKTDLTAPRRFHLQICY